MQMQALDWESFEFRADFFNRTIEEELVVCLDGTRGGEARAHLERIARQRATTIEALIDIERKKHERKKHDNTDEIEETQDLKTSPNKIFEANECSVCSSDDSTTFGALLCGHVLCKVCFKEMKKFPALCHQGCVRCPECRRPSQELFEYKPQDSHHLHEDHEEHENQEKCDVAPKTTDEKHWFNKIYDQFFLQFKSKIKK